jgi:hypothetical protein
MTRGAEALPTLSTADGAADPLDEASATVARRSIPPLHQLAGGAMGERALRQLAELRRKEDERWRGDHRGQIAPRISGSHSDPGQGPNSTIGPHITYQRPRTERISY